MALQRVRIYEGQTPNSQLIGFSLNALGAIMEPAFEAFMAERNHDWRLVGDDEGPIDGVSQAYVEVRPPLSDQHIQEFGILCTGGVIDDRRVGPIIKPYHDGTHMYDNRLVLPATPLDAGGLIAYGY